MKKTKASVSKNEMSAIRNIDDALRACRITELPAGYDEKLRNRLREALDLRENPAADSTAGSADKQRCAEIKKVVPIYMRRKYVGIAASLVLVCTLTALAVITVSMTGGMNHKEGASGDMTDADAFLSEGNIYITDGITENKTASGAENAQSDAIKDIVGSDLFAESLASPNTQGAESDRSNDTSKDSEPSYGVTANPEPDSEPTFEVMPDKPNVAPAEEPEPSESVSAEPTDAPNDAVDGEAIDGEAADGCAAAKRILLKALYENIPEENISTDTDADGYYCVITVNGIDADTSKEILDGLDIGEVEITTDTEQTADGSTVYYRISR